MSFESAARRPDIRLSDSSAILTVPCGVKLAPTADVYMRKMEALALGQQVAALIYLVVCASGG